MLSPQQRRNARASLAWRDLAALAAEQIRLSLETDPTETSDRRAVADAIETFAKLGDALLAACASQVGHGGDPWELLVETTETLVDRIRTVADKEDDLVAELAWEDRAVSRGRRVMSLPMDRGAE